MNRIFHIRETLLANIQNNIDYKNVEFILLDYNSNDGLGMWVKNNLDEYIKSGLLKYYRTTTPTFFDRSHSRNLACNLATGDIIALIDADNYTGKGYAKWIANKISKEGKDAIITCIGSDNLIFRDQGGKCAFHKDYLKLSRGFDEAMNGYGFEDIDFVRRLVQAGGRRILFEPTEGRFFRFIGHSNIERICNEQLLKNICSIYYCMYKDTEDFKEKCVLYLFEDSSFMSVTYSFDKTRDNIYQSHQGWAINENGRVVGQYAWDQDKLRVDLSENGCIVWSEKHAYSKDILVDASGLEWSAVPLDMNDYSIYLLLYTECWNRIIYYSNINVNKSINPHGWGAGEVSLNFGDEFSVSGS